MTRRAADPTSRARVLFAAAGAVLLGAALLGALLPGSGGGASALQPAAAVVVCEPGQRAAYELRSRSSVTAGDERATLQLLGATLEVCVLGRSGRAEPDRAELGLRLRAPELHTGDRAAMDRDELAGQALSAPFVVELDLGRDRRRAMVAATHFPADLAEPTRRQLDAIARSFQFALPRPGATRLAVFEDGLGRCRARFDATADGAAARRKLAYLKQHHPGQPGTVPRTVRLLRAEATFAAAVEGPWLRSAAIDEAIEVESLGALAARVEQVLSLELRERTDGPVVTAAQWLAGLDAGAAPGDAARAIAAAELVEARIAQAAEPAPERAPTAKDHMALQALLQRCIEGDGQDMAAVHALGGLLAEVPALAGDVEAALRNPGLPDHTAAGLCHALELGGAAQCQQSLAALGADAMLTASLRFQATAALGGVENPTPATEQALWQLVGGADGRLATAAQLALGSVGRALRETDPARYPALREMLSDRVANEPHPDAATAAMRAAGNTGDPALAPVATARLRDASAPIRAVAAETAGRLGGPSVAPELAQVLRAEPSGRVRASLVKGLVAAGDIDATCRVCSDLVVAEADRAARGAMARALADHVAERPELRPVLQAMLRDESSAQTAAYVAGRLYRTRR